jgi:hypothetical protein
MPSVAASDNFVHAAWHTSVGPRIVYRRSTDFGVTWGRFDTVTFSGFGNPCLAVSGDSVYLLAYDAFSYRMVLKRSTDRGLTWGPFQNIAPMYSSGGFALCSPFLHVSLEKQDSINFILEQYYSKSTDGGDTWTPAVMISDSDNYHSQLSSISVDLFGDPHITWFDYKYSPYSGTGDIFYRASRDTGRTWEPIDTLTVEHRALFSSIVAQGDSLHVAWSDDRVQPDTNLEIFYRMSSDLGNTWAPVYRLTYAERHSLFPSLAAGDTFLHLVWSDDRPDSIPIGRQIYYKRKALFPSGVEGLSSRDQRGESSFLRVYPNPSKGELRIYSSLPGVLSIYDVSGRRVKILTPSDSRITPNFYLWDGRDEKGTEVRSGVYFLKASKEGWEVKRKVVVVR